MSKAGSVFCWMLIMFIISTGCMGDMTAAADATQTFSPPVNPYTAITSTPGATPTIVTVPTQQPLLPTPTPFKHVIQSGDTLYGLALEYNISLDRLVSANPGLDTSLISLGTEVIIPFEDSENFGISTPTPYPVQLKNPSCLPTNEGGAWCFASVINDQTITLENISAGINIYDDNQNLIHSYIAIPPLDHYYPDQNMPVAVFIPSPLPKDYQVNGIILTALPSDTETIKTEIINKKITYNDSMTLAQISGSIKIKKGSLVEENQAWVAAIAYHDGDIIGIRKWVSKGTITADEDIAFELILYSLGPAIDEISIYSELH